MPVLQDDAGDAWYGPYRVPQPIVSISLRLLLQVVIQDLWAAADAEPWIEDRLWRIKWDLRNIYRDDATIGLYGS